MNKATKEAFNAIANVLEIMQSFTEEEWQKEFGKTKQDTLNNTAKAIRKMTSGD